MVGQYDVIFWQDYEVYLDEIHALVWFLSQHNLASLRDDHKGCSRQADSPVDNLIAVRVFCNHFANTLKSKKGFMKIFSSETAL